MLRWALLALLWATTAHALGRIVIIGDSTETCTGCRRAASTAAHVLERRANVVVHNFASPGARLCDSFFPGMVQASTAVDLLWGYFGLGTGGVLVTIGHNDWGGASDPDQFAADYAALLEQMPPHARVACVTPLWSAAEGVPNALGLTLQDYRDMVTQVCEAHGVPVVDGLDLVAGGAVNFPDGTHPGDLGNRKLGIRLARLVRGLGWGEAP